MSTTTTMAASFDNRASGWVIEVSAADEGNRSKSKYMLLLLLLLSPLLGRLLTGIFRRTPTDCVCAAAVNRFICPSIGPPHCMPSSRSSHWLRRYHDSGRTCHATRRGNICIIIHIASSFKLSANVSRPKKANQLFSGSVFSCRGDT